MNGQHLSRMDNTSGPHGGSPSSRVGTGCSRDGEDQHDLRGEDSIVRLIRGLAALLVLLVGLVAVPAFLVVFVGNPLPSDLGWDRLVAGLTRPDDGSILIGLVAVVAWVAWAVFAASVMVEVVAVASRQRVRLRVPGLVASQRLVSGLVVSVVALVAVGPQLSHASPTRATPAAGPEEAVTRSAIGPSAAPAPEVGRHTSTGGERRSVAPEPVGIRHTVERGDDLWSLAERFYGEGREWRKIAAANPDVLTGGPDRLTPGWRLLIPDVEQSPSGRTVVVQRGDSLSSIADRLWSDADRWPEVYEANRFQLDDPDVLPVGLALVLPKTSAGTAKTPDTTQPTSGADSRSRADSDVAADEPRPRAPPRPPEPAALPRPPSHGPAAGRRHRRAHPRWRHLPLGHRPRATTGRCQTSPQLSIPSWPGWPASAVCWRRPWSRVSSCVVARSSRSGRWADGSGSRRRPPSWRRRTSGVGSI